MAPPRRMAAVEPLKTALPCAAESVLASRRAKALTPSRRIAERGHEEAGGGRDCPWASRPKLTRLSSQNALVHQPRTAANSASQGSGPHVAAPAATCWTSVVASRDRPLHNQ